MSTHVKTDHCSKPLADKRRNRNRIWVCDCGRAYLSKSVEFWTDGGTRSGYRWVEIEPPKVIEKV